MKSFIAAACLSCAWSGLASAQAVKFDTGPGATGHWYEVVNSALSWTSAKAAAEGMTLNAPGDPLHGASGHLVTLGSTQEQAFALGLGPGDRWIGLTDALAFGGEEFGDTSGLAYPSAGATPASEFGTQRGEGWAWVTGEPLTYQNWLPGEPNNFNGSENFAHMTDLGTWTDRADTDFGGLTYVVEYSVPGTQGSTYLQIPAIDGEQSTPGHPDVMLLTSYSLEANEFTIIKPTDSTSDDLAAAAALGTEFPTASLLFYGPGEPFGPPESTLVFQSVFVSAYQSVSSGQQVNDHITFSFQSVPEPATLGLLASTAAGLLRRRAR